MREFSYNIVEECDDFFVVEFDYLAVDPEEEEGLADNYLKESKILNVVGEEDEVFEQIENNIYKFWKSGIYTVDLYFADNFGKETYETKIVDFEDNTSPNIYFNFKKSEFYAGILTKFGVERKDLFVPVQIYAIDNNSEICKVEIIAGDGSEQEKIEGNSYEHTYELTGKEYFSKRINKVFAEAYASQGYDTTGMFEENGGSCYFGDCYPLVVLAEDINGNKSVKAYPMNVVKEVMGITPFFSKNEKRGELVAEEQVEGETIWCKLNEMESKEVVDYIDFAWVPSSDSMSWSDTYYAFVDENGERVRIDPNDYDFGERLSLIMGGFRLANKNGGNELSDTTRLEFDEDFAATGNVVARIIYKRVGNEIPKKISYSQEIKICQRPEAKLGIKGFVGDSSSYTMEIVNSQYVDLTGFNSTGDIENYEFMVKINDGEWTSLSSSSSIKTCSYFIQDINKYTFKLVTTKNNVSDIDSIVVNVVPKMEINLANGTNYNILSNIIISNNGSYNKDVDKLNYVFKLTSNSTSKTVASISSYNHSVTSSFVDVLNNNADLNNTCVELYLYKSGEKIGYKKQNVSIAYVSPKNYLKWDNFDEYFQGSSDSYDRWVGTRLVGYSGYPSKYVKRLYFTVDNVYGGFHDSGMDRYYGSATNSLKVFCGSSGDGGYGEGESRTINIDGYNDRISSSDNNSSIYNQFKFVWCRGENGWSYRNLYNIIVSETSSSYGYIRVHVHTDHDHHDGDSHHCDLQYSLTAKVEDIFGNSYHAYTGATFGGYGK